MVIFHSYVSLPDGNPWQLIMVDWSLTMETGEEIKKTCRFQWDFK